MGDSWDENSVALVQATHSVAILFVTLGTHSALARSMAVGLAMDSVALGLAMASVAVGLATHWAGDASRGTWAGGAFCGTWAGGAFCGVWVGAGAISGVRAWRKLLNPL